MMVSRSLLRRHPLPLVRDSDDKEDRGRVLVIGGSRAVPGAILLSGVAALRAGAGKLQLATLREAALPLGMAVPEALVIGLPASRAGEISASPLRRYLDPYAEAADAVLVGPGVGEGGGSLLRELVGMVKSPAVLIIDGPIIGALFSKAALLATLKGRIVLTPHAGEMAALLGKSRGAIIASPRQAAREAAERLQATVVLKGAETWITQPEGPSYCFRGGAAGLGTSGSGDVLGGIAAGLAARGASPLAAALWAVWIHGQAGQRLSKKVARVGFLARELLDEIPALAVPRR